MATVTLRPLLGGTEGVDWIAVGHDEGYPTVVGPPDYPFAVYRANDHKHILLKYTYAPPGPPPTLFSADLHEVLTADGNPIKVLSDTSSARGQGFFTKVDATNLAPHASETIAYVTLRVAGRRIAQTGTITREIVEASAGLPAGPLSLNRANIVMPMGETDGAVLATFATNRVTGVPWTAEEVGTYLWGYYVLAADGAGGSYEMQVGLISVEVTYTDEFEPEGDLVILDNGVVHTNDILAAIDLEATLGARTTLNLTSKDRASTAAAFRPELDDEILIRDGATLLLPFGNLTIFSGHVLTVDDAPLIDASIGTRVRLTAVSLWRAAAQRRVSKQYAEGTSLKAIVSDLRTTYLADFGISLDPAMADGPALGAQLFDQVTVEAAFQRLASLSSWVYRLTPDNVIEWFPIGGRPRGVTFSAAHRNIIGPILWSRTRREYVNRVIVRYGPSAAIFKTDTFLGDGVTSVFPVTYPPLLDQNGFIVSQGYVTEGGVYSPLAMWNLHTGYLWYWEVGGANVLHRATGVTIPLTAAPLPAGVIATFGYQVQFPQTVVSEDAADVAFRGPWERIVEAPEIFDTSEALAFADSLRRRYSISPRTATVKTRALPLFLPGDTVALDAPERTLNNAAWLVTAVRMFVDIDQEVTTALTLLEGSEAQASWIDFWRQTLGAEGGGSVNQTLTGSVTPGGLADTALVPWLTRTFDATHFAGAGGGTWTVHAADVLSEAWKIAQGNVMLYTFKIAAGTVIAGAVTTLLITIPGGFKAVRDIGTPCWMANGGAPEFGTVLVNATDTVLRIQRLGGAAFGASVALEGQLQFEIQPA